MNIFISVPTKEKEYTWFNTMYNLFLYSLIDCGHSITNFEKADIVLVIQYLPGNNRVNDKKYILMQTEQNCIMDTSVYSAFGPDEVWGFDINNPTEKYICMGYHPYLEVPLEVTQDINVGFIGCATERRINFQNKVRNKYTTISTWDSMQRLNIIHKSKIYLNLHSYAETRYTEWDRICLPLANKTFILSESFYCPIPIDQFIDNYDEQVDYFLEHIKERQDIAENLYVIYKRDFDMRDILTERLK